MSHPIPGYDYTERGSDETRKEYANRKGKSLGKYQDMSHFSKDYLQSRRELKKSHRKLNKVVASSKNLFSKALATKMK